MKHWAKHERLLGALGAVAPLLAAYFGFAIYQNLVANGVSTASVAISSAYVVLAIVAGLTVINSLIASHEKNETLCPLRSGLLIALVAIGAFNAIYFLLQ